MLKSLNRIKYLAISVVLHSAIAFSVFYENADNDHLDLNQSGRRMKYSAGSNKDILPKNIEISMITIPNKEKDGYRYPKDKKKVESSGGFWGIGIYINVHASPVVFYQGLAYPSKSITDIIPGNPADLAGFNRGDKIFLVNGKPWIEEDIVGLEPRELVIGVERGHQVIFIKVMRGWIRTRGPTP